MNTAFVTGADRGLGLALVQQLLEKGWRVLAGQYMPDWPELRDLRTKYQDRLILVPLDVSKGESVKAAALTAEKAVDHIDLVISNAGVNSPTLHKGIRDTQNYDEIKRLYDVNALGGLRVTEALLPLTDKGSMKRLCYISSEAGSINCSERKAWYAYCMSKAALNMGIKILFNRLRPEGYTFRVYHPGWLQSYIGGSKNLEADLPPEKAAKLALAYFLRDRGHMTNPEGEVYYDDGRLVMRDWRGREWPW